MSSKEEEQEKAVAVMHATTAAFPVEHLAPWMSVHDRAKATTIAGLRAISRVGEELDRRAWIDAHPGEKLPDSMKDQEPTEKWEWTKARGSVAMYGACLRFLAEELHDIAPSIGGIRTKQAIMIATAQKTGLNAGLLEPPGRSITDRIRGKNKPSELAGIG